MSCTTADCLISFRDECFLVFHDSFNTSVSLTVRDPSALPAVMFFLVLSCADVDVSKTGDEVLS